MLLEGVALAFDDLGSATDLLLLPTVILLVIAISPLRNVAVTSAAQAVSCGELLSETVITDEHCRR